MNPVNYIIALLDADPHGWDACTDGVLHSSGIKIYNEYGYKMRIYGKVSIGHLNIRDTRRVRKAIKRQQTAVLAQVLLQTCESI